MAKKDEFSLDDDEFRLDDFGNEDFNFSDDPLKDDRNPVTKLASNFAEAAVDTVKDPSFVRRMLLRALPQGYSQAFGLVDEAARTTRELYNNAEKELEPAAREIRQAAKRALPGAKDYLPKGLSDRLENYLKEAEARDNLNAPNKIQSDEANIQLELGNIFKTQVAMSAEQSAQATAERRVESAVRSEQHGSLMASINAIQSGIDRQVGYQDQITAKYQQKQLELSYRKYFVLRDMFKFQQGAHADVKKELSGIVHNTALPDSQKILAKEALGDEIRSRAIGKLTQSAGQFAGNYLKNFRENLQREVRNRAGGINNAAQEALGMGNQLGDAAGMMGGPMGIIGNLLGGLVTDQLGNYWAEELRPRLGKVDAVRKWGSRLGYYAENHAELLNEFAQGNQGNNARIDLNKIGLGRLGRLFDTEEISLSPAVNMLKWLMPKYYLDERVQNDNIATGQDFAQFDNATRKSVVEIIPGFLSRILQSLEMARTGNSNVERVVWNHERDEFTTKSAARQDVFERMFSRTGVDTTNDDLDRIINGIDPNREMSDEARNELARQLMRDVSSGLGFNPARYSRTDAYRTQMNDQTKEELAGRFQRVFGLDENGKRTAEETADMAEQLTNLARQFKFLQMNLPNTQLGVQRNVNAGNQELLRELGLVTKIGTQDRINYDRVWDIYRAGRDDSGVPPDAETQGDIQGGINPLSDFVGPPRPGGAQPVPPTPTAGPYRQTYRAPTPNPVNNCDCFDKLSETFQSNFERLIKAVKENNVVEESQQQAVMQGEMVQLLAAIAINGVGQGSGNGNGGTGPGLSGYSVDPNFKWYSKFKRGVKWTAGKVGAGVGGFLRGAGSLYVGALKGIGRTFAGAGSMVAGAGRLGAGILTAPLRSDIYVKGRREPALTYAKLKEGLYRDQTTGKVIKKLRDIQGPVVDEENNVVLTADDIQRGIYDNTGRSILGNLSRGIGAMLRGTGRMYGAMFSPLTLLTRAINNTARATVTYLKRERDIYIPGEKTPRLLVSIMKNGGYYSAKTQRPIFSWQEIDGDVVDAQGNVILSTQEMSRGLVDRWGKPLQTLNQRVMSKVAAVVKAPFKMAWGITKAYGRMAAGIARMIGGGGSMMGNMMKRLFRPWGRDGADGAAMDSAGLMLLEGIYNLLDDRLPEGQNLRKGSWQEQLANKAKEKLTGKPNDAAPVDNKTKGIIGGVAGWVKDYMEQNNPLKKLFKKVMGDDDEEGLVDKIKDKLFDKAEDRLDGKLDDLLDGNSDADSGDDNRRNRRRRRGRGVRGRLRDARTRLGDVGRRLRPGGVRGALQGAGRFLGTQGARALALLGIEGLAGGGLAAGAATAGSALAGVLTAPVTLTVGAIALAGTGLYFGYKYLSRAQIKDLMAVRMAQYGVGKDEEDRVNKIGQAEAMLAKEVQLNRGGATLSDRVDVKALLGIFGVDQESEEDFREWVVWFTNRFKPVFLSWMTVADQLAPNVALQDLDDKVDFRRKREILDKVQAFPTGISPYAITASPFGDGKELATDTLVKEAIVQANANFTKEAEANRTADAGHTGVPLPTTAVVATVADLNRNTQSTNLNAAIAQANVGVMSATRNATVRGTGSGLLITANTRGNRLDALACVRLKTYGLKEMDIDKVRAIQGLEQSVLGAVSYDGNGKASFNDDAEKYLNSKASSFGISLGDQDDVLEWLVWFSSRFIPTFLNYCTAVRQINKAANPLDLGNRLSPEQQLDVAQAVNATTTVVNDQTVSVWTIQHGGFPRAAINLDATSVQINIDSLKEQIRNRKYQETTATGRGTDEQRENQGSNLLQRIMPNRVTGVDFAKSPSMMAVNRQAAAQRGNTPFLSAVTQPGGGGLSTYTAGTGLGRAVTHPGNGSGGDINELPNAKGNGWAGVKDLIIGAAKMAGVDAGLMATMASIESGFRATVKAGTSSATGLYQFIRSTWDSMVSKYGSKYGIAPGTPPTDARANALMGAEYLKENANYLAKRIGRQPTDTDLYMAHFLGAGGAVKFLTADPNASATQVMGASVANANRSIFMDGGRQRTIAEVYALMDRKVKGHGDQYGTEASIASGAPPAPTVAANPTTATPGAPTPEGPGSGDGSLLKVGNSSGPMLAPTPTAAAPTGGGFTAATSQDDAVIQTAQQQTERQAFAQQAQGKMSSDNMLTALLSMTDVLNQQLAIQTSMDISLKDIAANIKTLGSTGGSAQPAGPTTAAATPEVTRGNRPQAGQPKQAPINMRRAV